MLEKGIMYFDIERDLRRNWLFGLVFEVSSTNDFKSTFTELEDQLRSEVVVNQVLEDCDSDEEQTYVFKELARGEYGGITYTFESSQGNELKKWLAENYIENGVVFGFMK